MSRSLKDVAAEVQRCVYAWEHDARIIGNVTAVELRLLIRERDALITRLRAAEARTAWQPAADVQHPVEMGLVTLAHKCGWCRSGPPCESPMVTDGWSGGDGQWYTHGSLDGWRVTHYQPYPAPALPAAPEAPHG